MKPAGDESCDLPNEHVSGKLLSRRQNTVPCTQQDVSRCFLSAHSCADVTKIQAKAFVSDSFRCERVVRSKRGKVGTNEGSAVAADVVFDTVSLWGGAIVLRVD